MGIPLPHRNLLAEALVVWLTGDANGISKFRKNYLFDFLYVIVFVHAKCLDRHLPIVVSAFPNIAESSRGEGMPTVDQLIVL